MMDEGDQEEKKEMVKSRKGLPAEVGAQAEKA